MGKFRNILASHNTVFVFLEKLPRVLKAVWRRCGSAGNALPQQTLH